MIGYIIAAGKQTRFNSSIPKACYNITDNQTVLDVNIITMSKYCNKIYIVCSCGQKHFFEKICNKYTNVTILEISSGFGCGDAVYQALSLTKEHDSEPICIKWGDSIHDNPQIYECIQNIANNVLYIPVIEEMNPYVNFVEKNNKVDVQFSKFNEVAPNTLGLHDLSIFFSTHNYLYKNLSEVVFKTYYNYQYNTIHGNEFSFLDVLNYTDINAKLIKVTNIQDKSFNTIDEITKIIQW